MKLSHVYALVLTLFVATGALAQDTPQAILGGDASPAVLFNGEEISQEALAAFEATQIDDIRILSGEEAMAEFGRYGDHGVIVVTGKTAAGDGAGAARRAVEIAEEAPAAQVEERVTVVSRDPYVVIDGKPATNAEMQALDPGVIMHVKVLKGEQAEAKYGERGKDGVIEVTTKG